MTDTDAYRRAMRAGMTASAIASVSLDPTLLLVGISSRLPTHEATHACASARRHCEHHYRRRSRS